MPDHAVSDDPAVQRQLDRLASLSPGRDTLGLERIAALLDRLGNPERNLPPVFHVAGTNGKGSVCAFLRAAIEAAGLTCHVYTSPHLVRFNERIRLAGRLIEDATLAQLLGEVLDAADGLRPSFFEATTAAALLGFARLPADACILEVGLGGRLDATNVVPDPLVCGIAALGIDHEAFLLAEEDGVALQGLERIGFEKAGIAKRGAPLVTQNYARPVRDAIAATAIKAGAPLIARGELWHAAIYRGELHYRDEAGRLTLPLPRLPGAHQADNAALAIAMLRHQDRLAVAEAALAAASGWADWPARLQRLEPGPLAARVPETTIWLDGGHNAAAGAALGDFFVARGEPIHLVIGMLANKDPKALVEPLAPVLGGISVVPVPGHEHRTIGDFAPLAAERDIACETRESVGAAIEAAAGAGTILIAGSLYLAGQALRDNEQIPE
ncbi:MAG: bifunctional folylpolyglutamate synthase/dihydrofolate synthase [Sphingomonadales bacterium]|nr:bifunctional folylpolyglutamate synthase/dihydrofolate synthase [Sphingomonadales bacterium]